MSKYVNVSGAIDPKNNHTRHLNCPHCNWKNYSYSEPVEPTTAVMLRMNHKTKLNYYSFQCRNCNRVYNISEEIVPIGNDEES